MEKTLDKKETAAALITDLSKAFDCLNHELLIAKLHAYGFDKPSLLYFLSYLSGRKQRTKVNNSFSTWEDIISGIPQGSILDPLLFSIYINDIFLFINENSLANYADDNTPYTMNKDIDDVLNTLVNDTNILKDWFRNNYYLLNNDQCNLLITNHDGDISLKLGNEIITGKKWVKLLGIKVDNKLDFSEHVSSICRKLLGIKVDNKLDFSEHVSSICRKLLGIKVDNKLDFSEYVSSICRKLLGIKVDNKLDFSEHVSSICRKLLGIKVDNKLDFSEHVSSICRKANLKLHALA